MTGPAAVNAAMAKGARCKTTRQHCRRPPTFGLGANGPLGALLSTGLPHVWAARDCGGHTPSAARRHLPASRWDRSQAGARVAGENALGDSACYAGSLGTQVVKVFDLVAALTRLREHEVLAAGHTPVTGQASPDDQEHYPGAQPITVRAGMNVAPIN